MKRTLIYGVNVKNDVSTYSTEDLLRRLMSEADEGRDFSYEAERCLFKRWRNGIDLTFLIELLESDITRDRLRGAYYLGEAVPRGEGFTDPATKLGSDPLPQCRRAFVQYMTNSGLYGETIAARLAEGLLDFDLSVRLATINWAVYTTDDRFADFSRRVEFGSGATDFDTWRTPQVKRSVRGLHIARRLREGETVAEIRNDTPEEDSFTFDDLQFFEKRLKRYIERRKIKASAAATSASTGYDDYEIGVLGEEYDNMGKLKGDLPI